MAEAALAGYAAAWREIPRDGSAIMADRPLVRFFWRVLDSVDYWPTQARLWLAHAVCGPRLTAIRSTDWGCDSAIARRPRT
jgi:hypothetical protein